MDEVFVKKHWYEEDILFYFHFQDGWAVRQIEITSKGKTLLSSENPLKEDSMLADQPLDNLDLEESDLITKEEFDRAWNE